MKAPKLIELDEKEKGMGNSKSQTKWNLVNPEPLVRFEGRQVNTHPRDLSGKRVVLFWNGKPNGDLFLNRIGELLLEKVSGVQVIKAWERRPATKQTDPNPEASEVTAGTLAELQPDIVIGAPGDCAGGTTWLVADQLNLERLGIPTVSVITTPFMELAKTLPMAEGFSEACFVQVTPPIGMLTSFEIKKRAEEVFDGILKAATEWRPLDDKEVQGSAYPAEIFDFYGTVEEINRIFLVKKWSLGLPILPPTPGRVKEMLKGTKREPGEELGKVPPRMGLLTVELTAVYAAMAGCRPKFMPILIAALEGLLAPEANWRLALSGTGTSQLMVIINGPIVKEIGIGCEQGAAGKGYHGNGSIGYAINLIAYAVGGSRPPAMDRSTLASPADYVCWVFGENEDALPQGWKPLHSERGFEPSNSVVTVMASYPPVENNDHWSKSVEEHLRWWRNIASPMLNMGGPSVPQIMDLSPIIALGPEHAQLVASENWSKDDFRKAFWNQTRIPFSVWPSACDRDALMERMGPIDDETLIPFTLTWDRFLVVIAGGDGKQSHFFSPLPGAFPVSRLVDL